MTKEEILKLEGAELEIQIAEKVMGWKIDRKESIRCDVAVVDWLEEGEHVWKWFRPSKDIKDVWEVVDKLRETYAAVNICSSVHGSLCEIKKKYEDGSILPIAIVDDKKTTVAICKAALLAVME